jgi:hypothetical protein
LRQIIYKVKILLEAKSNAICTKPENHLWDKKVINKVEKNGLKWSKVDNFYLI